MNKETTQEAVVDINQSLQLLLVKFLQFLPQLMTALVTFVATLVMASVSYRSVHAYLSRGTESKRAAILLSQIVRIAVLIFGGILALEQVNFNVTGFVAGLGIAGFTLGFALQDISRNFIAGIILVIRQPFRVGDAVQVGTFSGSVTDVTLRDTVIKNWDGRRVIIPNATVFNEAIINYSALPIIRRTVLFPVLPEDDLNKALKAFTEAVASVEGVLSDPQIKVQISSVDTTGIQVSVYFWIDQSKTDVFETHSQVILAIRAKALSEGINLPSYEKFAASIQ